MIDDPAGEPPASPTRRRVVRRFLAATTAVLGVLLLASVSSAWASHGRGTTISAATAADGTAVVQLDQRTSGSCIPGNAYGSYFFDLFQLDGPGGARTPVGSYAGDASCYRSAGSFVEFRAQAAIDMSAMPDGWYVARHSSCCKVSNIVNVPAPSDTTWSSETQFQKVNGTVSTSPQFGVDLPFAASIGFPYSQNLAATDPDGGDVVARTMCCNAGDPDYAVSSDVIVVGADGVIEDGQILIPSEVTSTLTAGQFLELKVQVTDDEGAFSELDMVLSPTTNVPPAFEPPEQTTYEIAGGSTTSIPLSAADTDTGQTISFSISGQPDWVTLNQTPGNPATGAISVNPPPTVSGTFVVNVNANDDDPTLQATSSFTLTFTVAGVPDQPRDLVLVEAPGQITATWTAPVDTGTEVTGYRVEYREADSDDPFTAAPTSTSPSVITGLQNGVQYEVRVVALSANGDGVPATATIQPFTTPGPVRSLAASASNTSAALSWLPPASDGGSPVTAYLVERRLPGATLWTPVDEVTDPSIMVTGLTRGAAQEVRVRAVNAAGGGAWSSLPFRTLSLPGAGSSTVVVIRDGEPVRAPLYTGPAAGPLVSIAGTPSGAGSWATTAEGHVYTAGDAGFFGSLAGVPLNAPISGITPTLTGEGYYLVSEDGGVFAYGDAVFRGSMGGQPLNEPVQGIIPSCTGDGYYLVALDGGVFAYGDARFFGSMGGTRLNRGMLGIVPNCDLGGYWTFAADGGVFTFGNNVFHGSLGGNPPASGVVAMAATADGLGYWLVAGDGTPFPFGRVPTEGSD